MRNEGISAALQHYVNDATRGLRCDVAISYDDGVATLDGAVGSPTQARALSDLVGAHDGVRAVVDHLRVRGGATAPQFTA